MSQMKLLSTLVLGNSQDNNVGTWQL